MCFLRLLPTSLRVANDCRHFHIMDRVTLYLCRTEASSPLSASLRMFIFVRTSYEWRFPKIRIIPSCTLYYQNLRRRQSAILYYSMFLNRWCFLLPILYGTQGTCAKVRDYCFAKRRVSLRPFICRVTDSNMTSSSVIYRHVVYACGMLPVRYVVQPIEDTHWGVTAHHGPITAHHGPINADQPASHAVEMAG